MFDMGKNSTGIQYHMLQHPCIHQHWDMNCEPVHELGMEGGIQNKWSKNLHQIAQKEVVPLLGGAFE